MVETENMLQLAELAEQFEEQRKESDIFDLENDILKAKLNQKLKNLRLPNNVCSTPSSYPKCFLPARDLPIQTEQSKSRNNILVKIYQTT